MIFSPFFSYYCAGFKRRKGFENWEWGLQSKEFGSVQVIRSYGTNHFKRKIVNLQREPLEYAAIPRWEQNILINLFGTRQVLPVCVVEFQKAATWISNWELFVRQGFSRLPRLVKQSGISWVKVKPGSGLDYVQILSEDFRFALSIPTRSSHLTHLKALGKTLTR